MSQLTISKRESVRESNFLALQRIYDRLGSEKIVIVGTKHLIPRGNIEDELVYYFYKDRAVELCPGVEGSGKTVGMEWRAYQLRIMQDSPIVAWDVQKQMQFLRFPLRDRFALKRLEFLGIRPEGLKVKTFEPAFTHFNQADINWSIKLKDLLQLSQWEGYQNFIRMLSKDEPSQANLRAADAIWADILNAPDIKKDQDFLMDHYDTHYKVQMSDERKLGGTIGKSLFATLQQMKILGIFSGQRIDLFDMLKNGGQDIYAFISSFANSNDSFSYFQVVYSIYLASVLHDARRRNLIPRITKIRDEVDEALKTQEAEVIAREIKKDRVEQNNLLYALQYIADANKEMIGSSDAIITSRIRSEKDLELLQRKNPDDGDLSKLLHLETKTIPAQFAVVTYDNVKPCYPLSPPAQYHKVLESRTSRKI